MTIPYTLFIVCFTLFGAGAVAGLAWSIRAGQMRDFQAGATSIFDADEPVGRPTEGPRR